MIIINLTLFFLFFILSFMFLITPQKTKQNMYLSWLISLYLASISGIFFYRFVVEVIK